MAVISLINPRKRRHHKKHRAHKRRKHVARRHKRRARRAAVIIARRINPRRRHRSHKRRHTARRRNPISMGNIGRALVPAAIGGAGAVALDIALGFAGQKLPIPAALTTGYGKVALQVAGAFGLGWIAGKVVSREKAHLVTMGGLTVAAYSLIRTLAQQAAPSLPGLSGLGAYIAPSLGFVNPAASVGMGAYMRPTGTGGALSGGLGRFGNTSQGNGPDDGM